MCHGPNILNLFRRVASYADRFCALQRQALAVAEGYPMTAHVLAKRPLPAAKRTPRKIHFDPGENWSARLSSMRNTASTP